MTLYLRLVWLAINVWFRSKVDIFSSGRTPFRVWPGDLDLFLHMNNARYFSLMDLARTDIMIRSSLMAKLLKVGWYPVLAGEWIDFHKALKLWQSFYIETEIAGWDDRYVYLRQKFVAGGKVAARATVSVRFLKRAGGGVSPAELLTLTGQQRSSPPLSSDIEDWRARRDRAQISC